MNVTCVVCVHYIYEPRHRSTSGVQTSELLNLPEGATHEGSYLPVKIEMILKLRWGTKKKKKRKASTIFIYKEI